MKKPAICAAFLLAACSLFAQQPKNLKVLPPSSPVQLQRQMNVIRAALGVHCDYCHVNEAGKWDFASDAKPEKETARRMIKMTMELNKSSFNGQSVITCYTCHNGHIHPTTAVPLPQPQPPFPTPVDDENAYPAAKDLIAKYVAAIGGKPLPKSKTSKGTRFDIKGTAAFFDLTESDGRMYIKALTPDVIEQSLGPDGGWLRDKNGTRDMRPGELESIRDVYPAFEPFDASMLTEKAHTVGKDRIGEHDAWIVSDKLDENTRVRVWFDAATGLALRRLVLTNTPVGRLPKQTDFDDYRDVDGVKLPFEVKFSSVDPWIGATRKYSEIHAGAVDPKVFVKPAG